MRRLALSRSALACRAIACRALACRVLPGLAAFALFAGCAATPPSADEAQKVSAANDRQCRTGTMICRKDGGLPDKVQSVSPETFRDSIGHGSRAPVGGR